MACEYECLMLHCKTKLSSGKRMFSIPDWRMSEERKLLCEIWLEKLRNPQITDVESLTAQKCKCVCEDHFTADDILHTYFQDENTGWKPNLAHTILKPGSVPSLGYCPIAKKIVKIENIKQIIIKSEPCSKMEKETKIKANRPKQEFKKTHQPKIIKMVCYPTKAYPVQESVIAGKCMEEIKSGKENQHIFPEESNKCMYKNKAENNKTSKLNEEIMACEYECLMLNCKTKLSSGKRMFSIPDWRMSEEKKLLCEIWLKKLRNPKFTEVESLTTKSCRYVCEDHFTADEILHTYFQTEDTGCKSNSEHQILKPGAVPSLGYCPIAKKIVNIENIKLTSMKSFPCSVLEHETKGRANRSKQNTNQPEVVENINIATETSGFNNCKNAISYPADNEGIAETQVDMAFIKKIRDSFQIKCNRLGNLKVHTVDKTIINDNETEAFVHPEHKTTKSMKYLNTDNERDVIPIQLHRMYDTGIDKLNTVHVHDTLSIGNTEECTLRALEYERKENAILKTIPNDDNIIKVEKQDGFEITSRYQTKMTMDKEVFHMDVGITVHPSGTYLSNVHPYSKSAPICWYVSGWKKTHNHHTNKMAAESGNIEIIVKNVINDLVKCIIIEEDFQSTMALTAKQEKERLEKKALTSAKTIVSDASLSDDIIKTDELVDLLTEKGISNDESCRAEMFKCEECFSMFVHKGDLKNHLRNCKGNRRVQGKFICEHCGCAFGSETFLSIHINRTHKKIRKCLCPHCPFAAWSSSNLNRHLTHTGEHQYSCDQCSFSCIQHNQLKSHMRTHAREKPFKCDLCNYAAAWNVQLKDHNKVHGMTCTVMCQECGVVFKNSKCLKLHIMKEHLGNDISCNGNDDNDVLKSEKKKRPQKRKHSEKTGNGKQYGVMYLKKRVRRGNEDVKCQGKKTKLDKQLISSQ